LKQWHACRSIGPGSRTASEVRRGDERDERDRETARQRDREKERQRQTEIERWTDKETERKRQSVGVRTTWIHKGHLSAVKPFELDSRDKRSA
jgi:hypothetical protein